MYGFETMGEGNQPFVLTFAFEPLFSGRAGFFCRYVQIFRSMISKIIPSKIIKNIAIQSFWEVQDSRSSHNVKKSIIFQAILHHLLKEIKLLWHFYVVCGRDWCLIMKSLISDAPKHKVATLISKWQRFAGKQSPRLLSVLSRAAGTALGLSQVGYVS